ncbi:MAG: hypothetical protein A3F72_21795 [Bacteroidetes bacterium RIFCSPLOWO2_12_FULL_35_15]|nr:MAG: hypothetical protein A3F72_21795 [Bacteroidetes bacterium RIFCSPLOWO2_12_FULL_35_15]
MYVLFFFSEISFAQNIGINSTGAAPAVSAALDIDMNQKGLLIPRMSTTDRNLIGSPVESLLIYNTSTQCFEAWNNTTSSWVAFGCIGCQLPGAFTASAASGITATTFASNWVASAGATTYYLDAATDAAFTSYVSGYTNLNVGNVLTANVTGLTCATTYYYRVRANNTCGTSANSNAITVVAGSCVPTAPACGTQIFAAANLDAGTMVNSTAGGSQQPSPYNYKYCYNNVAANCATYGGLYEWDNVMLGAASTNCDPCGAGGVQGMCPAGYHIPTDLEWSRYEYCIENTVAPTGATSLATFQTTVGWRGTNSTAGPGDKMKATSSNTPAWDGTNTSGFNALPAGYRKYSDGLFIGLGADTYFWSATESSATDARLRELNTGNGQSLRSDGIKAYGFFVRCLQN